MKSKKMPRLTIARARELIKRELGISASSLTAPPEMNGNPNYPWYEFQVGNQTITVSLSGYGASSNGNEFIELSVMYKNSLSVISEYFYSDTMEYADERTDMRKQEDFLDKLGGDDDNPVLRRLRSETWHAIWHHYHAPKPIEKQNAL